MKDKPRKPRILLYDIETQANLAYVWQKYETNIIAYHRHWFMLSFAYKWLGEDKTHVKALPDYPEYKKNMHDDKRLVSDLWKLFDEADVVIAHNGRQFDIKKTNARFIKHQMPPPSPYKIIDTREVAKSYFKFDSNSLDDLGDYLGVGRKIKIVGGFQLWIDCEKGDPTAWNNMKKYNKQDVALLERVYNAMLPYMSNHPNIALMSGNTVACPNCGSFKVTKQGFKYTRVTKSQQYKCQSCGSWHSAPLKGGQVR